MTLIIDSTDETNELTSEQIIEVERIIAYAAKKEEIAEPCEVSVTFVSNERIHEINRDYRDKDAPTDVISFAMEEMGVEEMEIVGADSPRMLGDIIISVQKAKEQAEEYGHSFMRELGFLAVHGFLHLLGYDHMEKEEEEEMFTLQKDILNEYGLSR